MFRLECLLSTSLRDIRDMFHEIILDIFWIRVDKHRVSSLNSPPSGPDDPRSMCIWNFSSSRSDLRMPAERARACRIESQKGSHITIKYVRYSRRRWTDCQGHRYRARGVVPLDSSQVYGFENGMR